VFNIHIAVIGHVAAILPFAKSSDVLHPLMAGGEGRRNANRMFCLVISKYLIPAGG
jgi:hypothetical protein